MLHSTGGFIASTVVSWYPGPTEATYQQIIMDSQPKIMQMTWLLQLKGKHEGTLTSLMQTTLNLLQIWCTREELGVNPYKTVLILFTRRRKLNLIASTLNGTQLSTEVKYLSVIINKRLTWNSNIEKILSWATTTTWTCRKIFEKTWSLKPKILNNETIIKPIITYTFLIW